MGTERDPCLGSFSAAAVASTFMTYNLPLMLRGSTRARRCRLHRPPRHGGGQRARRAGILAIVNLGLCALGGWRRDGGRAPALTRRAVGPCPARPAPATRARVGGRQHLTRVSRRWVPSPPLHPRAPPLLQVQLWKPPLDGRVAASRGLQACSRAALCRMEWKGCRWGVHPLGRATPHPRSCADPPPVCETRHRAVSVWLRTLPNPARRDTQRTRGATSSISRLPAHPPPPCALSFGSVSWPSAKRRRRRRLRRLASALPPPPPAASGDGIFSL